MGGAQAPPIGASGLWEADRRMVLPNFIVVGAPRCATTTLHYFLAKHHQVATTQIKEPNFFLFGPGGVPSIDEPSIIRKSVRSQTAYEELFGHPSSTQTAAGEASPLYLYVREAAERILALCGAIRIVCVVRDPVERAWSHFLYALPELAAADGTGAFARLCDDEIRGGPEYTPYQTPTHLLRLGRYGEQVTRYQELFGAEQVKVFVLEELERDPASAGDELCDFLGIDRSAESLAERMNISGRSAGGVGGGARQLIRKVQPVLKSVLPPKVAGRLALLRARVNDRGLTPVAFDDETLRARLVDWFSDDIAVLESATGAELGHWRR